MKSWTPKFMRTLKTISALGEVERVNASWTTEDYNGRVIYYNDNDRPSSWSAFAFLFFLAQIVLAQQPTPIVPDPKLTPGGTHSTLRCGISVKIAS